MKKILIISLLIVSIIIPAHLAFAGSVNVYFGGKIESSFTISISIGGYGISLGPLARVKDGESGSTMLVLAPASLGNCTSGHHMVGIGQGANWHGYGYFIVILGFCD